MGKDEEKKYFYDSFDYINKHFQWSYVEVEALRNENEKLKLEIAKGKDMIYEQQEKQSSTHFQEIEGSSLDVNHEDKAELQPSIEEIQKLREENNNYKVQLEGAQNNINEVKGKCTELKETIEKLRKEIQEADKENDTQSQLLKKSRDVIQKLKKE